MKGMQCWRWPVGGEGDTVSAERGPRRRGGSLCCKHGRARVRSEESIMCITDGMLEIESELAAAQRTRVKAISSI